MSSNEVLILYLMSLSYHNFTLIRDITGELMINSEIKLNEFYEKWSKQYHEQLFQLPPLNPATLWMISYVNFVAARQPWLDLFDDTPISKIGEKWGLRHAEILCEEHCDPPLNYVLRRIRNGLAHNRIDITNIKKFNTIENIDFEGLMKNSYFIIRDENNGKKKFMIKINLINLGKLNKEVFETISKHVMNKIKPL